MRWLWKGQRAGEGTGSFGAGTQSGMSSQPVTPLGGSDPLDLPVQDRWLWKCMIFGHKYREGSGSALGMEYCARWECWWWESETNGQDISEGDG